MEKYDIKPSLSQAVRLKKIRQNGELSAEAIDAVLAEKKSPAKDEPTMTMRLRRYFPPEYSQKQIETVLVSLLTEWRASSAV
jgi:ParB family chromosome partitioning protein